MEVFFFDNGNTAVFDENGDQMSDLQRSYIVMFAEFLKTKGFDPTKISYLLPNDKKAQLFSIKGDTYNWRFVPWDFKE